MTRWADLLQYQVLMTDAAREAPDARCRILANMRGRLKEFPVKSPEHAFIKATIREIEALGIVTTE